MRLEKKYKKLSEDYKSNEAVMREILKKAPEVLPEFIRFKQRLYPEYRHIEYHPSMELFIKDIHLTSITFGAIDRYDKINPVKIIPDVPLGAFQCLPMELSQMTDMYHKQRGYDVPIEYEDLKDRF